MECTKRADTGDILVPARWCLRCLVSQTELCDELAVYVEICALEVIQVPAPLPNEFQQPKATMMVLLVGAEVLGQVVDALGEDGHLYCGRTGIGLVLRVLPAGRGLGEGHVLLAALVVFVVSR